MQTKEMFEVQVISANSPVWEAFAFTLNKRNAYCIATYLLIMEKKAWIRINTVPTDRTNIDNVIYGRPINAEMIK